MNDDDTQPWALPVDVLIEILLLLPVKILARFMCVSKLFRSMISDTDFIKRHLNTTRTFEQKLLIQSYPDEFTSIDMINSHNCFSFLHAFPNWSGEVCLLGSCDGLLAVANTQTYHAVVWNASIRRGYVLPRFWSDIRPKDLFFDGFGYDCVDDEYKWVRVIIFNDFRYECSVSSLKANTYKLIDAFPPFMNIIHLSGVCVSIGSFLCWKVAAEEIEGVKVEVKERLLVFHLVHELFGKINLPDIETDQEGHESDLLVINGCLGVSYMYVESEEMDIWVMKEFGDMDSWILLYTFGDMKPYEFTKYAYDWAITGLGGCGKWWFYQRDGEVHWRDVESGEDGRVMVDGCVVEILRFVVYMDSLLLLDFGPDRPLVCRT